MPSYNHYSTFFHRLRKANVTVGKQREFIEKDRGVFALTITGVKRMQKYLSLPMLATLPQIPSIKYKNHRKLTSGENGT